MAKKTYIKAITEGIDIALAEDPKTLVFGEDVGKNGGVFRATNELQEKYGVDRVFSTPLAESGILGMSIGLAATGWRPVPEIQFMGFTFEAMDSIAAQMSRMRFQYNGTKHAPITIRTPYGGGTHTAELHGDDLENFFVGIPGLRVVAPSSAYDAKGLIISAIENNDPVLFLENLRLYRSVKGEVPDDKYTVPLDKANVVQEGTDVTIIAYGGEVSEAQKAAKKLAKDTLLCFKTCYTSRMKKHICHDEKEDQQDSKNQNHYRGVKFRFSLLSFILFHHFSHICSILHRL